MRMRAGVITGLLIVGMVAVTGIKAQAQGAPANSKPDAGAGVIAMGPSDRTTSMQETAADNDARQKQLAADTAKLLELANQLKAAMDKTSKNTLSLEVMKKADEIEKLAHQMKEKMKK